MDLTDHYVTELIPVRNPFAHKGDFGKILCICGSVGLTGAPVLATRAAVRTGSGLVYLGVPSAIYPIIAVKCDETMPFPLPDNGKTLSAEATEEILQKAQQMDACLIGCGLGLNTQIDDVVKSILSLPKPLVIDADAITTIAHAPSLLVTLKDRTAPTVLTPHEGEFSRFWSLEKGREQAAVDAARHTNATIVLKGHGTVVASPDGRIAVNPTGNSGMAKGGSGDVLAGMIASLLGQGVSPFDACCIAVFLHGRAGDICAKEKGEYSMTPSDMVEAIPKAFLSLEDPLWNQH